VKPHRKNRGLMRYQKLEGLRKKIKSVQRSRVSEKGPLVQRKGHMEINIIYLNCKFEKHGQDVIAVRKRQPL